MGKQEIKKYVLGRLMTLDSEIKQAEVNKDTGVLVEKKTRKSEVMNLAASFGVKLK